VTRTVPAPGLPIPRTQPLVGHLGRWGIDPLALLEEGAALGPVFRLRLWRRVVVGYRPDWNRLVLRDLDTFRSKGSLSRLTPYLNGGVVMTDTPEHAARRTVLNPRVHAKALEVLAPRVAAAAVRSVPTGRFDASEWSSVVVRRMLSAAFFDSKVDDRVLASFLAPLDRPVPAPFVPRPRRFARMTKAIERATSAPARDTLVAALVGDIGSVDDLATGVEEVRIALAAAYDTTAHTLAWAIWHLATFPQWRSPELFGPVIDETLRLYPAGWIGSRVASRDVELDDAMIAKGTLVLYSPYLCHRDPELWEEPLAFRPERFAERIPAWGYIPFSAGERTCLGLHLARLMLTSAMRALCDGADLSPAGPAPWLAAGLTLRPSGGVPVERRGRVVGPHVFDPA
jgi:cytochrome P450